MGVLQYVPTAARGENVREFFEIAFSADGERLVQCLAVTRGQPGVTQEVGDLMRGQTLYDHVTHRPASAKLSI